MSATSRRLMGGYIFREELEGIRDRSQVVIDRLVGFSKKSDKPETLRDIIEMLALTATNAVSATDLLGYRDAKDEERQ